VLVVMEDRNVELGVKPALDLEAAAGDEMSSRLIPPKTGEIALTVAIISSTFWVARQDS
jgi:hypothetical protein